jgi:diaminopimelate decarboxylase
MSAFSLIDNALAVERVPLADIAARFGTPCYVYSRAALTAAYSGYRDALAGRDATICYAVKANSNLAILNVFARLGAGFDIVSVGKSRTEMRQALEAGIGCFNIESPNELGRLNEVAGALGKRAPIAFRVNPNVDPKTHPYISTGLKSSKFGVAYDDALALYRKARALPHIQIRGIACHIGSQLLDPAPAGEAAAKVAALADALAAEGIALDHIDVGGGMGIRYREDDTVPSHAEYLKPLLTALAGRKERLMLEPGRSLVGNAGLLLTRVEFLKHGEAKNFAVVDAAMNDLARPALYDAWHDIVPVARRAGTEETWEIVGPICESGDFLGSARPLALAEGDLLAVLSAGAYGMAMSSNYNTRPRAAEVMVDGDAVHLIRKREEIAQLFAGEAVLP